MHGCELDENASNEAFKCMGALSNNSVIEDDKKEFGKDEIATIIGKKIIVSKLNDQDKSLIIHSKEANYKLKLEDIEN